MPALTDVLASIAGRRGDRATQLPAIALSVTLNGDVDPTDPQTLTRPVATIEPVVHPDIEAILDASSATRRGRFSWAFGLGEDTCDPTALRLLIDNLAPGLVLAKSNTETTRGPSDISKVQGYNRLSALRTVLQGTLAVGVLTQERSTRVSVTTPNDVQPPGIATVSTDGRVLWISFRTNRLIVPEDSGIPEIPLNLRPCGKAGIEPKLQIAAEVVAVADWARNRGIEVIDSPELIALQRTASRTVAVWPTRGRPAEATAAVGRFVDPSIRTALNVGTVPAAATVELVEVTAALIAEAIGPDDGAGVHPGVADIAAMEAAVPVEDPRLKEYQSEVVGLHLATAIGYVNALPTGMGKTITTLASYQKRAELNPGWRGLVVVEANVREQWTEQAAEWFPEARVITVVSRADNDALRVALATSGSTPVLAICSYALASDTAEALTPGTETTPIEAVVRHRGRRKPARDQMALFDVVDGRTWIDAVAIGEDDGGLGSTLLGVSWHDIAADEAVGLRNSGTKLAAALWRLRANSEIATALTGTPITKGLDDLGRLLAWVRNDADLFRGCRLEKFFDLSTDEGLDAYVTAIGPLVVRRDKSELAGEIPELRPSVVRLDPTPQEKALASAARDELKRVYDELVSWITIAETYSEDADKAEELATARTALVAARGAWLGGTTLARMAASDPEALLGSNSAGTALLASQGLISDACDNGGTKRDWCVKFCTERAARGQRILIFTEFATVARGIIDDLRDAGVSVGAVMGGGGKARDRDLAAYRNGELSVLVATSSGERGLNLQMTNVMIHYDLPWTPDRIVQRTGRAQRIGSALNEVEVIFPIMTGTIEERVAALVVARAVTSLRALDTSRGVEAANTELGRVLGDLALSVDSSVVDGKDARMLDVTRDLLAFAA